MRLVQSWQAAVFLSLLIAVRSFSTKIKISGLKIEIPVTIFLPLLNIKARGDRFFQQGNVPTLTSVIMINKFPF